MWLSCLILYQVEGLERVRNNQRNCRQRRRDYVANLESRIASCEEATAEAKLALRATEEKLRSENHALQALLDSSGVDLTVLEHCPAGEYRGGMSVERQFGPSLAALSSLELHTVPRSLQLSNLRLLLESPHCGR